MSNSYVTILDKLSKAVETNAKYKVEDALNKNLLAEDARKYETGLLNLLQKDKDLKSHFFAETDGGLVFKKDVFLQFISNKEFLPDSYTRYANKIGLGSDDGSLLSGSKDVVLNWPYKDAVLEGGQDKEDQKRSEVFFNEVLAPDQITRLLDDKVFTNWKRYDKDGEHDLDELKDDDNLIIKGNNLVVLHSLKKRYAGKVKLIYIDPPYNTENDSFGYNDSFNHSTWLTFMKNRLQAAKKLLAADGAIFVQCDDNEQAYLKVLMDEIFKGGFKNTIAVKMSEASGVKMNHARSRFPKIKEYIHFYAMPQFKGFAEIDKYKIEDWDNENNIYLENFSEEDRKKLKKYEESANKLSASDIENINSILKEVKTTSLSTKIKDIEDDDKTRWLFDNSYRIIKTAGSSSLAKLIKSKYPDATSIADQDIRADLSVQGVLFYYLTSFNRDTKQPRFQVIFADSNIEKNPCDFWQDIKTTGAIATEGGVMLPNGKKPEKILERVIKMTTNEGDIVLDYHLGSGTTAAVAHKMKRQYIGIEQLYYGDNDPTVRLKNVINGDQSGISKSVDWQGGGSFVYANIMNNANKFRKRIEAVKDDKEYLTLLEEARSSSFLSYRVDPTKLNEAEFRKLSSADKRHLLLKLIDSNTLYVNYEDINDPSFKVSDIDKKFNKELYK